MPLILLNSFSKIRIEVKMVIQLNEKMKKFTRQFPKLPTKIKLNKKKTHFLTYILPL